MSKERSHAPTCVLYVCCGSKCKKRESKHLYKQMKGWVKEKHLKRKVQVIKTGCTDNCKWGPVVAVMPSNEWHFSVNEEKAMSLVEQRAVAP